MNNTVSVNTINKHARTKFNTVINRSSISHSKYLQSLPYNPIGMTWAETGFFVID